MAERDRDPAPGAAGEGGRYRIGALARITGLSAHTIRGWERRYGALRPVRTPGGDRLYSQADLERLRLLQRLRAQGHSIGVVAALPDEELARMLAEHAPAPAPAPPPPPGPEDSFAELREHFVAAIAATDQEQAERMLARCVAALEPQELILELLAPALTEIGERWFRGELSVGQEHLASALLRNHLAHVMRAYGVRSNRPTLVATTPEGELHEFGALLAAILAATWGWQVMYLGPSMPPGDLVDIVRSSRARALLLSWVYNDEPGVRRQLVRVRAALPPSVACYLGGRLGGTLSDPPPGITVVASLDELERHLRRP